MSQKPSDIDEYVEWLSEEHSVQIDQKIENHYDSVVQRVKRNFTKTDYWNDIISDMNSFEQKYYLKTGYKLFIRKEAPEVLTKPFESFLDKTFRKNVVNNSNWPDPPHNGWVLPSNWFKKINDTVRTVFIVKYLGGVDFLIERLEEVAEDHDFSFRKFYEAREEGYYAAHSYTTLEFEIPKLDFDTERIRMSVEIQITTQLQEVIRKLLHKYYEEKRLEKENNIDKKWQWKHGSDEFSANYLGHILHYIEGMIVEIRNK